MTVYVHKMEGQTGAFIARSARQVRGYHWQSNDPWFLLTADTEDELHAFAESLDLTRMMFRPAKQALPKQKPEAGRYPITTPEKDRAVALGAQLITAREAHEMLQKRASGIVFITDQTPRHRWWSRG